MPDTHDTAAASLAVREPVRWRPSRDASAAAAPAVKLSLALARGLRCRCPVCGKGAVFDGYLRVVDACAECAAPLGQVRADDAPPYFTIFIVAHVVVLLMLVVEDRWQPALWVHAALWLPLTVVLSLALLRPVKGATVALMLRLGLRKSPDEI